MRSRRRTRRCNVMLEFAMVLPFMLFLLAFSIDMGRMMYAMNAAQEIVATAARQSAVFGAAGVDGDHTSANAQQTRAAIISGCNKPSEAEVIASCNMGLYATSTAIANTPGGGLLQKWSLDVAADAASNNGFGRVCTATTPLVKLTITYEVDWLTPGMRGLLGITGNTGNTETGNLAKSTLAANATARCEVEFSTGAP
jgi:Flp pilus assembly protein TadG